MQGWTKGLTMAALCWVLSACTNGADDSTSNISQSPALTATTLGEQTVRSAAEYLSLEPYMSASLENGAQQARICKACHSLNKGGPNMVGPALFGMFGSEAGQQAGFAYSPVLRDADFVWTPRALDAWLLQPAQFMPGNRMTFAGVSRKSDRNDLIAYLLAETASDEE